MKVFKRVKIKYLFFKFIKVIYLIKSFKLIKFNIKIKRYIFYLSLNKYRFTIS